MAKKLRVLDLFSGIAGFAVAFAKFAETIGFCDNDPGARAVLKRHMKSGKLDEAPIYEDIRKLHPEQLPPSERGGDLVDLITAGFPCQDISCAGLHAGLAKGTRSSLVKQVVRLIRELRDDANLRRQRETTNTSRVIKKQKRGNIPSYLFLENVGGITSKPVEYKALLNSLNNLGYDTFWDYYSAAGSGAPHKRVRWFLLGVRRYPAPVSIKVQKDAMLEKLVSSSRFSFKDSVILPAEGDEHIAARKQAVVSMLLLGNSVVPAQANKAFVGLHARASKVREHIAGASSCSPAKAAMHKSIPVPGMHVGGILRDLMEDPKNITPQVARGGPFKFNIKPVKKKTESYQNTTPLQTGTFSLNYLGTPRRAHSRATAPTKRAFADFGTGVAFCKSLAKRVKPRGAMVKHSFIESAMGFPREWTRDPQIWKVKRR